MSEPRSVKRRCGVQYLVVEVALLAVALLAWRRRPEGGKVDGEGYMECPHCEKDAFLCVLVRNGVIVGIEPNAKKLGYIPN
jgi:hypothetical protein